MSNAQVVSSRAALASAALLSLALLAGCESGARDAGDAKPVSTANTNPDAGALIAAPPSELDVNARLITVGNRVHFELDRHDLTPNAQATLRQQAAVLQNYPQFVVTIEGHADERGTREYNLALGERRADAVRNYLTALGIAAERITVISYGKERPECPDASEGCWSQNRRGVTVASQ
ncbi:MAG TPA: peptidoglycan-associated lipoprotein Pal [Dongiaceae bacterium]|nr:peptidoglycan-associated lipoprotein Pal [Dongiaceae bacterium]